MSNRKNVKVHRKFVELLRVHFEGDQRQIPIELRNRSWSIRFSGRINAFIHKDLARFDFNLAEDAKARFDGRWPESKTIYRAFVKGFTANPDLIQICGWYVFGEEWPIEAIRFQQQEDQQAEYNMEQVLKQWYLQDSMFNSIRIPGDKSGFFGQLDMDSYYANLSYVEQKELTDRNTLIRKEQESLRGRFTHAKTEFLHLGTDYLSADIIQNNQRIVITGNPGVGKSTYARWLCFQWAKDRLSIPQIPIYIQLRDLYFNQTESNVISKYVHRHYLGQLAVEEVETLLTKHFYRYLLILDGYDELNRQKQVQLERDLRSLTQPIDQARYIVLSRPYGLIFHKFSKEIVLQIDGFTESSIENYIQAFLTQNPKEHKQKKQLLKLIEENYILREHAHTPLMLSYIVLIYNKSKHPEKELFSIKSTYDLQASVFRWLIDYSIGHEQLIQVEGDWQRKAGQLAYEMLMDKEYSFKSSFETLPFTRDQALQFSQLGIGNIIDDDKDYNWRFSFATITLQEFLASHYLLAQITAEAFVYLVQDQYHWNFAKMILGAMEQESGKRKVIPDIFQRLEKKYSGQSSSFFRYIYYSLLSETNKNFLAGHLKKVHFQELLSFYQTSSFDEIWHPIIQESFYRIYHKLSFAKQQIIHQLIIDKSNALKEEQHRIKTGGEVGFLLLGIVQQTEIRKYPLFVENCIELLGYLVERIRAYQEQQHKISKDEEMLEQQFSLISSLYDEEIATENTVFIVLQLLVGVSKELLLPYESRLLDFRKHCPITAWLDLEEIIIQLQDVPTIIQELENSIQKVAQLPDGAMEEELNEWLAQQSNREDNVQELENDLVLEDEELDDELFSRDYMDEYFPPSLIYLSGAIYKAGIIVQQEKNTQLVHLMIQAAKLYLQKIFHPDAMHANASRQTGETIIQGLVFLNTQESLDLIFDYIYLLGHDLVIDIQNEHAFHTYVDNKFNLLKKIFDKSEFGRLCKAFENTWNGRHSFARYRDRLSHLFFSVLQDDHTYFAEMSLHHSLLDDKQPTVQILQQILTIPFFTYDRKFFIDQIISYEHQYDFLKFYAIPFLFEMNFPFYQDRYWQYLKQLEPGTDRPLQLIDLLTDNSFYHYASNLGHIKEVLCRLSRWIQLYQGKEEDEYGLKPDFQTYAYSYVIIVSNTLRLMKRSGPSYEDHSLLNCIRVILSLETVQAYLEEPAFLETLEAPDMVAFILYYHYTLDPDFLVQLDYDGLKLHHPQTHKELITDLIDLMVDTTGEVSLDNIHALKPIIGEAFYQDLLQYLKDYDVLYASIESTVFEQRLNHPR